VNTAARPTRRLFFALWPDQATRQALVRATRKAVRRAGGRPVPPHNYHITLAFLGNQPSALFDEIVAAGRRVTASPMELCLDTFHCWPRPRVFWFGPAKAAPKPVQWPVGAFSLMESMDGDPGPEYSVVARFPQGSSHDP